MTGLVVANQPEDKVKHMVGFTYNEISRRYVDSEPEFYEPDVWRARPEGSVKQGSGGLIESQEHAHRVYEGSWLLANATYKDLTDAGTAPEQARMVLPQSMLTTYIVTGSLYAWANAYIQRSDSHAQKEIQHLAAQWDEHIRPLFPVSWSALVD